MLRVDVGLGGDVIVRSLEQPGGCRDKAIGLGDPDLAVGVE